MSHDSNATAKYQVWFDGDECLVQQSSKQPKDTARESTLRRVDYSHEDELEFAEHVKRAEQQGLDTNTLEVFEDFARINPSHNSTSWKHHWDRKVRNLHLTDPNRMSKEELNRPGSCFLIPPEDATSTELPIATTAASETNPSSIMDDHGGAAGAAAAAAATVPESRERTTVRLGDKLLPARKFPGRKQVLKSRNTDFERAEDNTETLFKLIGLNHLEDLESWLPSVG